MRRILRLLVPLVVAFAATRGASWAPESAAVHELAVRAASEQGSIPNSARTGGATRSEVAASDSRAPQRGVRTPEHHACPTIAVSLVARAHAPTRTTGLAALPACARDLAIPFDATAPPRRT